MTEQSTYQTQGGRLARWWAAKKTALYTNPSFQDLVSRLPLASRFSRKEGEAIFQLMTGFVDTQILLAFVRTGALAHLRHGPLTVMQLGQNIGLDSGKTRLLCRAGMALKLVDLDKDTVRLARRGILVLGLPGIQELIDHHSILYDDLKDPVAFLTGQTENRLAAFWPYVFGQPADIPDQEVARYSDLMTKSQFMVARDTLAAVRVPKHIRWLDVGGGSGAFIGHLLDKYPTVRPAVFDVNGTQNDQGRHEFIPGSFFEDDLPGGFDVISLIRVLYDHSDGTVKNLLAKVYTALPEGGRLVISEPMLGSPAPNRFGDTYFAIYTMAMNTGKTRSPKEITDLLREIGFSNIKTYPSRRPFVTTIIEAVKN